mmetsp:Transcript_36021/g.78908  ORF Transcript_36021/g.78908 Transcript_36021/m.78908 type:complete len:837 (-) Transcript_36021:26-2536(-)
MVLTNNMPHQRRRDRSIISTLLVLAATAGSGKGRVGAFHPLNSGTFAIGGRAAALRQHELQQCQQIQPSEDSRFRPDIRCHASAVSESSTSNTSGSTRRRVKLAREEEIRSIEREIVQLGRSGKTDDALALYDSVWVGYENRSGLKPTTRLMNSAIDACARARPPRMKTAFGILETAMEGGERGAAKLKPNVYTAGTLMSCCARARDADRALSFLREMQDKYDIAPNAIVYSTAISACERSRPPRADLALELLREATADPTIEMNVVGYNTAISALARVGDWRRAVQLLDEMEAGGGSELDQDFDKSPSAKATLLDPNNFTPPLPDEVSYGTVMAACERAKEWRQVLRVADTINAKSELDSAFFMDGLTITSALHACQQLGLADHALKYLDMMKGLANRDDSTGINRRRTYGNARIDARKPLRGPDDVAYKLVISACSRCKNGSRWADGIRLLREMESYTGTAPDVVAYTASIAGCAEAGEWRTAFQLLEEMKSKGCEPNVVTLSACISSCATACANAAKATSLVDDDSSSMETNDITEPKHRALGLLGAMKAEGSSVKPNVFSYNAAIRACAEAFDLDMAFTLFDALKQQGLKPSVVTYGSLMTACERVGNLGAASRVMKMIREEAGNIRPNEVIYGAMISCCRKSGQADRAVLLLRKMIKEGLSPNIATFNTVIMAQFQRDPDIRTAVLVYKLMQSQHSRVKPNRRTYNILVRGLAENNRPNDAEIFLWKMKNDGFVPDVDLFTALVGSYERSGQPGKALRLMESMERDGYNFYEIKVLDKAFKKAVKFASAVERGLRPSEERRRNAEGSRNDEAVVLFQEGDDELDSVDQILR